MFTTRRITTMGGDVFRDEYSIQFDGVNDYVSLGDNLDLGTSDFTIAFWVKVNDDFNLNYFFSKYQQEEDRWYFRGNASDPPKLHFYSKTSDTERLSMTGSTGLDDYLGKWVHIVMSVDRGTSVSFYINGQLDVTHTGVTQTNSDSLDNTGDFNISRFDTTYANQNISELAYYNTALTASQVATIYNGREPYNHKEGVASSNLQAWWRMGDGVLDGSSQRDISAALGDANNDMVSQGIICDETNPKLGAELYTDANSLSTNEANDVSTGITALSGITPVDETTIVSSGSARSLKYTALGSGDGIAIDLNNYTTAGKVYRLSVNARHLGSDGVQSIRITGQSGGGNSGETQEVAVISSGETTFRTFITYWLHDDTDTRWFISRETAGSDDGGMYLDSFSIKEVQGNAGVMSNMDKTSLSGDTP